MITKEQYEFLKERLRDAKREDPRCTADLKYKGDGLVCNICPLRTSLAAPCTGQRSIDKITELMKEYRENDMKDKAETTKKHNKTTNETENYYDRLQRYYKKDFRAGDRVFIKPQGDCKRTKNLSPNFGEFGKIITISGSGAFSHERYFFKNKHLPKYSPEWLLPVVSPEDAYRAMLDGRQVTSNEGYSISKKTGGVYYDAVTKCFVAPDDKDDNEPLSDVDFIILDNEITLTKQEIADKFGVDVENLIIED